MVTASSIAARASSRRPRSASQLDWLFSDLARSGRNASGRASASWRRMVTASSIAARASSRRPRLGQAVRLVVQRRGEVGQERVGAGLGELAVDGDGFLDRGQGLLPPPQVGQASWTGCSATSARSGRNASGRASASWRWMVTASSIAARASSRRPRSASRSDWLFSDPARSGRNASGRASASWR